MSETKGAFDDGEEFEPLWRRDSSEMVDGGSATGARIPARLGFKRGPLVKDRMQVPAPDFLHKDGKGIRSP